jgi:hypothetical protein
MTNPLINLDDNLPRWLNGEDRQLHAFILSTSFWLDALQTNVSELQKRVPVLQKDPKNVQSDVITTQQLLSAEPGQTEKEKYCQQSCEQEYKKIVSNMARLEQ